MTLKLALRLESPRPRTSVGRDLQTLIGGLARGPPFFLGGRRVGRPICLQKLELAAVVDHPERHGTAVAMPTDGALRVRRAKAGVVQLAGRGVNVAGITTDPGHAPAERALRALGARRTAQLQVVRGSRDRASRSHECGRA